MTYSSMSKTGGREKNEDSVLSLEREGNACFVVADGLGAHGKGEIASRMLTEVFGREFCKLREDSRTFLSRAYDLTQKEIMSAKQITDEMKTTGVALSVINGRYAWGHIGDTRLYHFHKAKLRQRTFDHSVAQMLVVTKEIGEDEIARHPDRNLLLKAVGDKWDGPCYELSKEKKLSKGDSFLLCTDGFWEHVSKFVITRTLREAHNAADWLTALTAIVEENGKHFDMDNYSAIAIMV